jgi:hypothetical protein
MGLLFPPQADEIRLAPTQADVMMSLAQRAVFVGVEMYQVWPKGSFTHALRSP